MLAFQDRHDILVYDNKTPHHIDFANRKMLEGAIIDLGPGEPVKRPPYLKAYFAETGCMLELNQFAVSAVDRYDPEHASRIDRPRTLITLTSDGEEQSFRTWAVNRRNWSLLNSVQASERSHRSYTRRTQRALMAAERIARLNPTFRSRDEDYLMAVVATL